MNIICKFCGNELHTESGKSIWKCEYCGKLQTVPKDENAKKAIFLDRANRLQMSGEYDRALSVYKAVAAEFPDESEAFWGICLCTYGVEYVRNPASENYEPICHNSVSLPISEDNNFIKACKNSDPEALVIYKKEADAIDRIRKELQSIASEEDAFDVFICCKDTIDGTRTEDSLLAEEAYKVLTDKGMRVFFSGISLADKPEPHEPYINAALSSSTVLLAFGTSYENLVSPQIRSEWKQYLAMIKTEPQKKLIPCYKDLDEYDRPPEFNRFKSIDMGKPGWLEELAKHICG